MKLTCPSCKRPFPRTIARGRNRRYCSDECRREMHNRRRREARRHQAQTRKKASDQEPVPTTPAAFRAWVVDNFEMAPGERQLLELAVEALEMARDANRDDKVRLSAMQRFQALLRDLQLPELEDEVDETEEGSPIIPLRKRRG